MVNRLLYKWNKENTQHSIALCILLAIDVMLWPWGSHGLLLLMASFL